jgi:CRISPR system Cascade subunit CasC
MIGNVEFNSACFYRYASIDVKQLIGGTSDKNGAFGLQGDTELARRTVDAFIRAFIQAIPTGKQNTFAAHNLPSLVFAIVRTGGAMSLANAFVKPITACSEESLVEKSIKALDDHYGRLTKMYGDGGLTKSAVCQMEEAKLNNLKDSVDSVEQLIAAIVPAAFAGGGK